MDFGDHIRTAREEKGLSQDAAAKLIRQKYGVRLSAAYLSMIERGERKNLTLKLENALKDFFDIQIKTGFLLEDYMKPSEKSILNFAEIFNVTKNRANMHIPILGMIRAGLPILAEENIEGYLDVPDFIQADYVLRVVGDSMVGAGIIDGDLAICRESQSANSGQIVVAIKDLATGYSEATLKYYFDNGKGRTLRPANPNYEEIDMKDGYRIAGTMVASVRQDAPGYQVYKDYLTVCGREEWTEVIEEATQGGFKPEQVKDLISLQIEIAKKFRNK